MRADFEETLRFWFDRGVDGFRVDVAHGLVKAEGLDDIGDRLWPVPRSAAEESEHPHWDREEVHGIYRQWRRLADSYAEPRVFVAEAWVSQPDRLVRYVRHDELHTAFNFNFLVAPWRATQIRETIDRTLEAHVSAGAPATWVLANHDVAREVSRYARPQPAHELRRLDDLLTFPADFALGTRRARAAALLMLALPGSAYIYQGQELGLPEVEDLSDAVMQDPAFEHTRGKSRGRDGCRVPLPWCGIRPPFGFSPPDATADPWLPQPRAWADLTAAAQDQDRRIDPGVVPRSAALAARRTSTGRWSAAVVGCAGGGVALHSRATIRVPGQCGRVATAGAHRGSGPAERAAHTDRPATRRYHRVVAQAMTGPQQGVAPPLDQGLIVVANRLPLSRVVEGAQEQWRPSPGGLASAVGPAMTDRRCTWVGWPGDSRHADPFDHDGIRYVPVAIDEQEIEDYYEGFSNGTLWPLYHDAIRPPEFRSNWWEAYETINQRFAEVVASAADPNAVVWVHDYQLQLVPAMLRRARPDLKIGFFLHISFPPQELFMQLPWRQQIVEGILGADVVGFQVPIAARNFAVLARRLTKAQGRSSPLTYRGRDVHVGAYPISIDVKQFEEIGKRPETLRRAKEIRESLGGPKVLLLGADRLDYTKGITARLGAYKELLEEKLLSVPDTVMVQIAVPTRSNVPAYIDHRNEIERLIGELNGDFGHMGAPAVHYLHQNLRHRRTRRALCRG